MSEPVYYAACRVIDLPTPHVPSVHSRCAKCGVLVWVNPLGLVPVKLVHDLVTVVCVQCAEVTT
jgi:hypothetical protein